MVSGERKITMAKKKKKKGHAKSVKAFDCEEEINYERSLWRDLEQSRTRSHNLVHHEDMRRFCTAARAHLMSLTEDDLW